jgi:possible diguanylate cyclase and metal dependent phosphohydrolase
MEERFSFIKKNIGILILFASLFVALIFLYFFLNVRGGVSADRYKRLENIRVEVCHEDGTKEYFNSNLFRYRSKKDRITMVIPLDEEWKRDYQSVNFFLLRQCSKGLLQRPASRDLRGK